MIELLQDCFLGSRLTLLLDVPGFCERIQLELVAVCGQSPEEMLEDGESLDV
jgi:hypothetical protein